MVYSKPNSDYVAGTKIRADKLNENIDAAFTAINAEAIKVATKANTSDVLPKTGGSITGSLSVTSTLSGSHISGNSITITSTIKGGSLSVSTLDMMGGVPTNIGTATKPFDALSLAEFSAVVGSSGTLSIPCLEGSTKKNWIRKVGYYAGGSTAPTITFPEPFPNACTYVNTVPITTDGRSNTLLELPTKTSFKPVHRSSDGTAVDVAFLWAAEGY